MKLMKVSVLLLTLISALLCNEAASEQSSFSQLQDSVAEEEFNPRFLKKDSDGAFALLGNNVTFGAMKNLIADPPKPITVKL